ncbi:MAG: hypothetical protein M0T83_04175 [Nitrospiraceae bacterium]|jgi:hypothetical protein|nr:hypothetical protein [Nitrospiraceae bacterium]
MKKILLLPIIVLFLETSPVLAESPYLVAPDGTYLGNLNNNPYDPNSVNNPYGQYGNPYSPNSIHNPYGVYGSPFSPQSPNDPYGQGPMIISPAPGGSLSPWPGQ